jgi:hypothetical protein
MVFLFVTIFFGMFGEKALEGFPVPVWPVTVSLQFFVIFFFVIFLVRHILLCFDI